ncbi:hypothetical protein [Rummeliibacillus stabekisii]|uniref:hypothetical protein n=1 Tax=Rummeliibacillus stabekisii TaxID=241244 RepID=UPI00116F8E65|nr:hypothetical protein [Rummeliibacillus stabekisii]MBB5171652.1 hypothetical protein [Rummeliibacillus stabekisii]GEL05499.1 hypothetical protein RST01_21260 [Rummeliibacillus stabekisii]
MSKVMQKKIGRLTILAEYEDKSLMCKCDCGNIVTRSRTLLYNGTSSSSCGCLKGKAIALGISRK